MSAPGLRASALELEGAVLRFTHGFTRRANSARVDAGGGDLDGLITRAEQEYRSRGLRPGFRLTPLTPAAFERLLRERGYVVDTEAIVMVAERAACGAPAARRGDDIELAPELDEEWLRVFKAVERDWPPRAGPRRALGARIRGRAAPLRARARRMVCPPPPATGASRTTGSTSRASRPSPSSRRRGLARVVSERLFAWGAAGGARRAILQAETKNAAAQGLYAQLGFRPRYIYRDLVPGR